MHQRRKLQGRRSGRNRLLKLNLFPGTPDELFLDNPDKNCVSTALVFDYEDNLIKKEFLSSQHTTHSKEHKKIRERINDPLSFGIPRQNRTVN